MSSNKLYDQICMFKNPHHEEILHANCIVRNFIETRKLVLYGGTAIDYALRLHGDKIYPDDTIPDYDFYSTNYVKDTYDLIDIIYEKLGKPQNLRCHPAIHFGTMTIKLHDIPIADISHNKYFDNIKTLTYRGLLITDPLYQYVDMHSSLSLPFDNSPREVIFHRWKKDVTRLNLLRDYYPPKCNTKIEQPAKLSKIPNEPVVLAGLTGAQAILDIIEDGKITELYGNEFYINDSGLEYRKDNLTFSTIEKDGLKLYNIYGNQFLIAGVYSLEGKEILIPNINTILFTILGQYFITKNTNYLAYYVKLCVQKDHKILRLYPTPERIFGSTLITPSKKFRLSKMAENIGTDKIADEYLIDLTKIPKGYSPFISESRNLSRPDQQTL